MCVEMLSRLFLIATIVVTIIVVNFTVVTFIVVTIIVVTIIEKCEVSSQELYCTPPDNKDDTLRCAVSAWSRGSFSSSSQSSLNSRRLSRSVVGWALDESISFSTSVITIIDHNYLSRGFWKVWIKVSKFFVMKIFLSTTRRHPRAVHRPAEALWVWRLPSRGKLPLPWRLRGQVQHTSFDCFVCLSVWSLIIDYWWFVWCAEGCILFGCNGCWWS